MREHVDEDEPWFARECRVDVKLVDDDAAMVFLTTRQELEADDQRGGVEATVRFDDADDDVALQVALTARGFEHDVRLTYARRGPKEDHELAPGRALLFGGDPLQ